MNKKNADRVPDAVKRELISIGDAVRIARKRRNLTQGDLAALMFVAPRTVVRLEKGDPGIALSNFLTALFCMQLEYRVSSLFNPEKDMIGIGFDVRRHASRKLVRKQNTDKLDF